MPLIHPKTGAALCAAVLLAMVPSQGEAAQYALSDFVRTANIYGNLNREYPNTGATTPGSTVGVPNASVRFDPAAYSSPNYVAGSNQTTNGVAFQITSDAAGHDFSEVNGGATLVIPVSLSGITSISVLASAYNGQSANFIVTGADGATQRFDNVFLPDFNGGGLVNDTAGGVTRQTALQVRNVGAGGTGNSANGAFNTYNLTEVSFALDPALVNQRIESISVRSNGYETLILAATAVAPDVAAIPEPASLMLTLTAMAGAAALPRRRRRA